MKRLITVAIIVFIFNPVLFSQPVYFADKDLEDAIMEELGMTVGPVTQTDMLGLTQLIANISNISDLTGLEYAANLDELSLHNNFQISDLSPLSGLTNLTTLYLYGNNISDLSPLSGLTNLVTLYLYGNQISDVSALSELTNLVYLDLWGNQISDVSALSGLTNLELLNLCHNKIGDIWALSGMTDLIWLDIHSNNIDDLSPLSGLTNLELLDLDANHISDLSALAGLTNLEWLDLDENLISDLSALSGLTNMVEIDIHANQVGDISPLAGLIYLEDLDLDTNQISDISYLADMTDLVYLDLHSNQISDISPLAGLINLVDLDLDDNHISDLSPLSGLINLEWLDLDDNRISDISPLAGLTNLAYIDIHNNQISHLPDLSGLTNLELLDLDDNQISDISALAGLMNLKDLDLDNNQISDVSALAGLTNLALLDLNSNQISDISTLVNLTNLDWVDLRGNPLDSDACAIYIPQMRNNGITVEYNGCQSALVPDIVGLQESQALTQLTELGLDPIVEYVADSSPAGQVISQEPLAGTWISLGANVYLTISDGSGLETPELEIPLPAAQWKLDETSGYWAFDSSGNNYHGMLFGNPSWQPTGGVIDGALEFDGTDDYVIMPVGPLISSMTECTISSWVNWSGTGGQGQRIWDFGSGEQSNMFLTTNNEQTNTPSFAITTAGSVEQTISPAPLPEGWHHIAITIDPNITTHTLYIDGQVVAKNTNAVHTPGSLGPTIQNYLGKSQRVSDPTFDGLLDDVCIYDCVLNSNEIAYIAGAGYLLFSDDFNTPHDYLTEGLGFYDGLLNGTIGMLNASTDRTGSLYIESTNSSWNPGPGPLLYVNVTGNFIATVKITDFAGKLASPLEHNAAGIMARNPASDGGLESWVSVAYYPTWTAFIAWDTIKGARTELGQSASRWDGDDTYAIAKQYPYIQLERSGDNFYPRISSDGVNFIPLTDLPYQGIYDGTQAPLVIHRPDLPQTLQVGLNHATFSENLGYAAFDDFVIQSGSDN
ncbi:MAG: leucine-rich repeat domain-containing protein [Sedimentisphaerales bacterium]|nr:leucine-rich repeat domain-containing protein [Sedimentisphaerales bacterium]